MVKKIVSLSLFLLIIVLVPGYGFYEKKIIGNTYSYTKDKPSQPNLEKIEKPNGWKIPGIDAVIGVTEKKSINIDRIEVQKKHLELFNEPIVEVETYSTGNTGQLLITSNLCVVRNLFVYENQGEKFAYQADLVLVDVNLEGVRTYYGNILKFYYFDEDGNGSFETRNELDNALHLPDWIKIGTKKKDVSEFRP